MGNPLCILYTHICHVSDTIMDAEGFSSHICLTYPQLAAVTMYCSEFYHSMFISCSFTFYALSHDIPSVLQIHHSITQPYGTKSCPNIHSSLKYPFLNTYSSPVHGASSPNILSHCHMPTMSMSVSAISVS